jgi:small-conductance mechanosensitive channel
MMEEFDAAQSANPWGGLLFFLGLVLLGLLLEFGLLRWLQQALGGRGWRFSTVLLRALRGQPLLFFLVLSILAAVSRSGLSPTLQRRVFEIGFLLLFAGLCLAVVRFLTGLLMLVVNDEILPSVSLVKVLIRVIGALVVLAAVLGVLGVPITPLLTLIAGSSLGLSLALRDPLANLFAGIQILASDRIYPGEYVRLSSGEEGYIDDIRWSETRIRLLTNDLVVVPNAVLNQTIMTNFDRPDPETAVLFDVDVSHDSDLPRVKQVTLEVANQVMREISGAVQDFECKLRYNRLGDSSVGFTVIMRAQSFGDQFLIRDEFVERLVERYRREGISMPFPIRTLRTPEVQRVALIDQAATAPGDGRAAAAESQP